MKRLCRILQLKYDELERNNWCCYWPLKCQLHIMVKHKQFVCSTFPLKCEKMYVIVSIQTTWSYSASNPIRKILAWIRKADRLNFSKPLYKPSLENAERVLPCPMKKLICRNSRFIEHLWMLFERNSFLASASNRFSSEQPLWKIVYLPEGHLIWNPFFVKLQSSTLLFNTRENSIIDVF